MHKNSIAIDGPAGAGKSTIAKMVAEALNMLYIDTGAMYRTVAYKAIKKSIDTTDKNKLIQLINPIDIKLKHINGQQRIFLDGEDVSEEIRTPEVSIGASNVAAIPEVRIKLVELQREIAKDFNVVMDGRDIGTSVLPEAALKIFLTASLDERARRRFNEIKPIMGEELVFSDVLHDIEKRDKKDENREMSPLAKAKDAVELDTTGMSIGEVADKIINLAKSR